MTHPATKNTLTVSGLIVTEDNRPTAGWLRATYYDMGLQREYRLLAKVYDEPSHFGINDGRTSKLEIRNEDGVRVYNYDRGLDLNHIPNEALRAIVDGLEKLPTGFAGRGYVVAC